MRKTIALIAGILSVTSALAIKPGMGPADTGAIAKGSWVDVRVTANVVNGIAVNEASPIDFGNLVRDNVTTDTNENEHIYKQQEKIWENTSGRVVYRANTTGYNTFKTYLQEDRIDLGFIGSSGEEDDTATNSYIKNVKIEGIGKNEEEVLLVNGQGEKVLRAYFLAYDKRSASEAGEGTSTQYAVDYENGNLGRKQKLGYYEGTVRVFAIASNTGK